MHKIPTLIAAAAALLLSAAPAAAAEALTKDDVERIVHDYILAHPSDILNAVQKYQEDMQYEQQQAAIRTNRQDLYNDTDTPLAGNPDGDVTVVEFFDYNCGYCKHAMPDIRKLIKADKNVRVLFKDFPILGATSETAAKWSIAAARQKKFFEFHQAMMDNRKPITQALLEKTAEAAGLDMKQARADVDGASVLAQIERNRALANNMDISGTPAFVIGDELSSGAIGYDRMKTLIAEARAKGAKKEAPADDDKDAKKGAPKGE